MYALESNEESITKTAIAQKLVFRKLHLLAIVWTMHLLPPLEAFVFKKNI